MDDLDGYRISDHALEQMARRGITRGLIQQVLAEPEQATRLRFGRLVLQARLATAPVRKVYLVRVFVDDHLDPAVIVTVYRTTKFRKYGSTEP